MPSTSIGRCQLAPMSPTRWTQSANPPAAAEGARREKTGDPGGYLCRTRPARRLPVTNSLPVCSITDIRRVALGGVLLFPNYRAMLSPRWFYWNIFSWRHL